MKIVLNVTGHEFEAEYSEKEIHTVFLPVLRRINEARKKKGSRLIVYLAAPPGAGKTTLSLFLEYLHTEHQFPYTFQSVSMDGFHHKKEYLLSHWIQAGETKIPLNNVKGSPESFDLPLLKQTIKTLRTEEVDWPLYDRTLHDVSDKTVRVDSDIVFIEGNWLLLEEEGWRDLKAFSDFSLFIEAEERLLRPRLIGRKMRGGLPRSEAETFYVNSDQKNVFRVLENRQPSDVRLEISEKGKFSEI